MLIAIAVVASVSAVSAGFLDGLLGGELSIKLTDLNKTPISKEM